MFLFFVTYCVTDLRYQRHNGPQRSDVRISQDRYLSGLVTRKQFMHDSEQYGLNTFRVISYWLYSGFIREIIALLDSRCSLFI